VARGRRGRADPVTGAGAAGRARAFAAAALAGVGAGSPTTGHGPAAPPIHGPAAWSAPRPAGDAELRARGPDGAWRVWWRAGAAPARWPAGGAALAGLVRWHAATPGVETGELALSGPGEAWRVRAVLVRLDPRRVRLALDARVDAAGRMRPWDVEAAPPAAAAALNAGMFGDDGPWGWVMHGGHELQPPGTGPLASAVVVGTDGRVRVVAAAALPAARAAAARGEVAEAIQGYPTLLEGDGEVPALLRPDAARTAGGAIDLEHRDARLAVAELADGRVLVALTRFDGLGGRLGGVPLGLTVPETAALVGALGGRRAVLLDGGLSAQLLVRDATGGRRVWRGVRRVPLGLVAWPGGHRSGD
jgi:hypothetical protein